MSVQRYEIDAHEGDAEQEEDRLGDVRAKQRAERRHRDRDESDSRHRADALAAEPCESAQGKGDGVSKNGRHAEQRLSPIPSTTRRSRLRRHWPGAAIFPW